MRDDLEQQVEKAKRAMWVRVASRQAALLLAFHDRVVAATPVDTGNARAHWVMSIGVPRDAPVPPVKRHAGEAPDISTAAQDRSFSAIAGYQPRSARGLKVLFDCNAVAYIGRLNEGASRQAPAMYVEQAAAEAVLEINTMSDDDLIAIFPEISASGELAGGAAELGAGAGDELALGGETIISDDAASFAGSGNDER